MITMISSVPASAGGGGSLKELYSDTTDANYGLGKGLAFHADAEDNISIGENSLNSTTGAALKNIAIGTNALTVITDGDNNICIGYSAGSGAAFNTESNNIGIGAYVFSGSAFSSQKNTFVGVNSGQGAMDSNADGTVAVGYEALKVLSSGAGNTAIGYNAGLSITTGGNNVAIGYIALDALTPGDKNTAVGAYS